MDKDRKEQLMLAVLLEVSEKERKNGEIVLGAESRIIADEKYNRIMLNGKQTKGRKELQFILYDFKKSGIVELVKRGLFRDNNLTYNTRMEKLFDIQKKIDSGVISDDNIILNKETLEEIKETYDFKQDWKPKYVEPAKNEIVTVKEDVDPGCEITSAVENENKENDLESDVNKDTPDLLVEKDEVTTTVKSDTCEDMSDEQAIKEETAEPEENENNNVVEKEKQTADLLVEGDDVTVKEETKKTDSVTKKVGNKGNRNSGSKKAAKRK